MTDQHQTEAQRLAALLRSRNNNQAGFGLGPVCDEAALELLRLNAVHTDLECVKMQLAACGVVAMADTPDSAKKARTMHPDYESASCDDVKRRVDECIELRARVAELEDVLTNLPLSSPQRLRARIQRLEEMLAAVGAGGVGPLIPATVQHQRNPNNDNDLQGENGHSSTSSSSVPAGCRLVPVEPTQAMLDQLRFGWSDISTAYVIDRWKRTIGAAPQPPAPGCKATMHGDQMVRDDCKSAWDANDPNPPACLPAPPVVEQPEPAYLLRDLAADIGVAELELIAAIRDAGLGDYSINMMLPARVCVAMCKRFAEVDRPHGNQWWAIIRVDDLGKIFNSSGQLIATVYLSQAERIVACHNRSTQPKREPLTDEELRATWRASPFRGNGGQIDWFMEGFRAGERAHGIGGEA